MTRMSLSLAVLGAFMFVGIGYSQEPESGAGLDCAAACETNGWLITDVELLFIGYYQEGGVADTQGNRASFDWRLAPRFTLGYEGPDTFGVRARYFAYDDDTISTGRYLVGVRASAIETELYQDFQIGCRTEIEYSLGLRYQDFEQSAAIDDPLLVVVAGNQGFGGVIGLQAKREFFLGRWYARGRFAVMVGDAGISNTFAAGTVRFNASDNVFTSSEIGIGYELSREIANWGLLTVRSGLEWQHWGNVAMADTSFGGLGNDDVMENSGFAGLACAVGLEW